MTNPKVLFSKLIGKVNTGGVMRKLFADTTPKTTENFRALCNLEKGVGISGRPLHYYGSSFHRASPGFMCQGEVFTRGYASCAEATYGLKTENLNLKQTGASIRIASNAESGSEFQEIIADYVHHEMTRTWILVLMRLFMIMAIKDVFVSLVYSDKTTEAASTRSYEVSGRW